MATRPEFTLLYDGDCPLCSREVAMLRRRDRGRGALGLVDIATPGFDAARYGTDHATLMARIHGVLPDGKVLIPGVIESKSNFIEHPELIAQRIARYANLVGRENVIAGSDCGYGTWVGQAAVDPDVVWAKFAAMAEGARIASKQFWK